MRAMSPHQLSECVTATCRLFKIIGKLSNIHIFLLKLAEHTLLAYESQPNEESQQHGYMVSVQLGACDLRRVCYTYHIHSC